VNLDPISATASSAGPSPDLVHARAALGAQLAGLAAALARLDGVRGLVPAGAAGPGWRGAAQSAYGAGVAHLGRELDDASAALRAAKRGTSNALSVLASRG
jgi:hypothetical protein